ncbi:MAG: undecaprenyldiphospho-muramoylpentapeptide beta-N-acetylglucosaminyltransferase [Nitrospinae bacterium]|nr:undecaprenyldiphospho-muramoylpentapeptide beta-N-acetylglucosaminyltransferase [Nitrospinota bacterium]
MVTAGGTGGHIFPALAVAEEMRRLGHLVLFAGSSGGPESSRAAAMGFDFFGVDVKGLDRRSALRSARSLFLLPRAVLRARKAVSEFKADAVIGCGGYASAPSCIAAVLGGVPLFLLEQNVDPGLVTRRLARRAEKVYASFAGTKERLGSGNVVVAGNPVRKEFSPPPPRDFNAPVRTLLVIGGSQGARSINRAMTAALPSLSGMSIRICHQTGPKDVGEVRAAYSAWTPPPGTPSASVEPFFEDMAEKMRGAHLAVGRAGASSCAELLISGLPSILVPFPGAGGHQRHNALALENFGAATVMEDAGLDGGLLAGKIVELLRRPDVLGTMSSNAESHARPDAARFICSDVISTMGAD